MCAFVWTNERNSCKSDTKQARNDKHAMQNSLKAVKNQKRIH